MSASETVVRFDALERVQRRTARWITNKHDRARVKLTALLYQLHLEPPEERRRISRVD